MWSGIYRGGHPMAVAIAELTSLVGGDGLGKASLASVAWLHQRCRFDMDTAGREGDANSTRAKCEI